MPVLDCAALDDAAGLAVLRRVLAQPRSDARADASRFATPRGPTPAPRSARTDVDGEVRLDHRFDPCIRLPRTVPASLASRPRLSA